MGLTYTEIHELLSARRAGARFDQTLMLGRQNLYLHERETAAVIAEFNLSPEIAQLTMPFGRYADDFLRTTLHVAQLDSMDVSSYEDATVVHDLNTPIAADLEQCFDAVIDGGTLEHIFNVPVALASLMRMTKVDGRVISANPANNLCGHGFFQFSPELMFRVYSEAHGFAVERIALIETKYPGVELMPRRGVYDVKDPDEVGGRVMLVSRHPAMLVVHARKTNHLPDPLGVAPQQSDYTVRWKAERRHDEPPTHPLLRRMPPAITSRIRGHRQRLRCSLRNRQFYAKAG
jgi:hypothetical protein